MIPASKRFFLFVFLFLVLNGILVFFWYHGKSDASGKQATIDHTAIQSSDLSFFENSALAFKEISDFLQKIAQERGARYAYALLRVAPIQPGIDLHLLGHVVGEELYAQEGLNGMYTCTQEFRNACSHSIVVGRFLEKGQDALSEIADACRRAPGGAGAYTMCFHGLGHGVLAYFDYDLKKAIEMCEKTGSAEGAQCIGGAIMEIIGGGFHDRIAWEKQNKVYLKQGDPLYPCNSDLVPQSAKNFCYTYLTPHLFKVAGANLQDPQPNDYKKAFSYCSQLPLNSSAYIACYGGFGKDFVVIAKNRDIRNIDKMNDQELGKVYEWCSLADSKDGERHCLLTALGSLFWGGENDPQTSVRFCELALDQQFQPVCFRQLIVQASRYLQNNSKKVDSLCTSMPSRYHEECASITQR